MFLVVTVSAPTFNKNWFSVLDAIKNQQSISYLTGVNTEIDGEHQSTLVMKESKKKKQTYREDLKGMWAATSCFSAVKHRGWAIFVVFVIIVTSLFVEEYVAKNRALPSSHA